MKIYFKRFFTLGGWFTWGAIGGAVVSVVGGAIVNHNSGGGSTNSGGAGGQGLNSSQNVGQTAADLFNAYQTNAPGMYNLAAQYGPQYSNLQNLLLGGAQSSLLGSYQAITPGLQDVQNAAQQEQAAGNIGLLGAYGSGANAAYLGSNPQLAALQGQYTGLAMTQPNPVSQLGPQGQWGQPFANQAGQMINGSQVQAMQNPTLNALQQQAQSQLALGSSMSQQQASTVQNQILSNYNSMGRAEDPTAIAGLATGLDTYGQQLLQQREQNAANVAGLGTSYAGVNLSGQQSNLASQLGLAGLQYEGLYGSSQQALQGGMANQQAQLSNANYQQQLLQGASALAYQTGQNSYNMLLNPSSALQNAYGLTNQAGNTVTAGLQLSNLYNPFATNFNSVYGSQTNANMNNAATNAGLMSQYQNLFTSPTVQKGISSAINTIFSSSPGGGGNGSDEAFANSGFFD